MNNQARKGATVGEIVNLMSVDTENIQHMIPYLWACWSSVLQIGVCLYFLYDTVKYAMFAGLGFLILLFPFNGVIMNMMQKLQKAKMKEKDNRIKLLTEVLNGIKVFYHLFQFSLLAMHVQFKGTGIHQSLRVSICHQAMVELLMIWGQCFIVSVPMIKIWKNLLCKQVYFKNWGLSFSSDSEVVCLGNVFQGEDWGHSQHRVESFKERKYYWPILLVFLDFSTIHGK